MKNSLRIKRLVGISSLAAVVVVLQLIATYMPKLPGGVTFTLALIPIVIGAILYGPSGGAILGAVMGVIVIVDPATLTVFMPHNPAATIILCLLKTATAGAVSGLFFKLLHKKNLYVAVILATIVVPIINTTLFSLGAWLFFGDIYGGGSMSVIFVTILTAIWLNFIIEFAINVILAPIVLRIVRIVTKNYNIGCSFDLEDEEIVEEAVLENE
ncbi:MAG: ECF transporter S component [Anaeroplasmataceae bacterium]|nr:ECF transporter S component [Anaeroplasmataceae bacterium]